MAEWLARRTHWSCWRYGEREVVSSNPDRGTIVGWVFHPTRWLERFSLIWICLSFQIVKIYLEHCPRGEALIISHLRFSSNEVASHVKQLPFRPLLLLLQAYIPSFFFSSGLSRHLGSPQWSSMVLCHRLLSCAIPLSSPTSCRSLFAAMRRHHPSTLSLVFILFRMVSCTLSACRHVPGHLLTCPHHFNCFCQTLWLLIFDIVFPCNHTHSFQHILKNYIIYI